MDDDFTKRFACTEHGPNPKGGGGAIHSENRVLTTQKARNDLFLNSVLE
jgi:hypothetical protein